MAQQGGANNRNVRNGYRILGPADNERYYNKWVASDQYYNKLFLCNVNIPPLAGHFDEQLVPMMSYLAWYGHHYVIHPGAPVERTKVRVGSWADLMGPQIATNRIANQQDARGMIVEAVKKLLTPDILSVVSTATAVTWAAPVAEGGAGKDGEIWTQMLAGNGDEVTPENAVEILLHISHKAARFFTTGGLTMLVHVYISTLKRGNVTEAFTQKIADGLGTDLDIRNFALDPIACKIFYDNFGQGIDDESIAIITETWTRLLPAQALRLRLTVQQAAGAGITALAVTGRAIRVFTDFNWSRIRQMYPDEWTNFLAAVNMVGDNRYYGFKRDLGIVKSTNYKDLAYVAKELLIKINGESSLRSYGGWTRRAKYQAVVDQIIADYEGSKMANILTGAVMPLINDDEEIDNLRATIIQHANVYV